MSETLLFLRQLISRPLQVSAIAPSSRFLARAMARDLGPQTGRVVEFGPGTGRLTQGILNAGVAPENLTLFEMNPDFVSHLRARFPGVTVHLAGAQTAPDLVTKGVGAVVSGLPLLSMPMALRQSIVAAAFHILARDGLYIQFTYGPRPALDESQIASLGLTWRQTAYVALNLPPARVHTFRRA
jgi:phosphatidylethanolamine/phosphatidyl-N-methylethanolamine N-methyltransferase